MFAEPQAIIRVTLSMTTSLISEMCLLRWMAQVPFRANSCLSERKCMGRGHTPLTFKQTFPSLPIFAHKALFHRKTTYLNLQLMALVLDPKALNDIFRPRIHHNESLYHH